MNVAYCMDCMKYMKTLPDKYFDLAVVDPPYGDGGGAGLQMENALANDLTDIGHPVYRTGGAWASKYGKKS